MSEINIPTGPLDEEPYDAIRPADGERWLDANRSAILHALDGIELGDYDQTIIGWLARWENHTVATIASWILRVRNAATDGKLVLDEPDEPGLFHDDGGELLVIEDDHIVIVPRGDWYVMDADEADEWAAHLAGMAAALRTQAGTPTPPPAATASAVLRRALDLLQGRDVVDAIRTAAGDEQLADAALRELADYCGYDQLDQAADCITRWQQTTGLHNIRGTLPHAADHAEREGR